MSASPRRAASAGRLVSILAIALAVAVSGAGLYLFAGGPARTGDGPTIQAVLVAATADAEVQAVLVPATAGAMVQAGVVGEPFARPLEVRVLDADGRPVPGVTVRFGTTSSGDGAGAVLSATAAVSDAGGFASVTATANLTPSDRGAGYRAWASVAGQVIDFPLRNYDPTAPAEARFIGGGSTGFIATGREQAISIQVVNAVGAPLPGVPVRLARNTVARGPTDLGFTPDAAVTDVGGFATFTARAGASTGAGTLDVLIAGAPLASFAYQVYAAAVATQIRIISGGNQFAARGVAFANPIVFEVDDAGNLPVEGVVVSASTSGPATVTPTTIPTNARGRGQVTATALDFFGDALLSFDAGGPTASTVVTVGDPASRWLRLVDGGEFWAPAGAPFPKPLTVRVVDGTGTPVAGGNVAFSVALGSVGISLSSPSAVSDAAGLASVTATAGGTTGWNSVVASIGNGFDKSFYLPIIEPAGVGYFEVVSGGGQGAFVGGAYAEPLVVRLLNYSGSPVAGANVTWFTTPEFSADATVTPPPATTNASGQVSIAMTANSWPGSFTFTFTSLDYTTTPVQFHVTETNLDRTLPGPATGLAVKSGDPQSAPLATAFGLPLTVLVTDAGGVPVDGVVVTFAAPGSGASAALSAASATTSIFGLASVTATANLVGGAYQVTASATGLPSATFHLTNVSPPTTTALTSSLTPSTYGGPVTFTATVSGTYAPTGTVTFTAGATTLCGAKALVAQVATCTVSTLGAGIHTITATYPGDASNTGSAGTLTQTVNQAAQAITFAPPATGTYADPPLDLALSAGGGASGNPVTFSVVSGPGLITGTELTYTGVGPVVVAANQAGDANHSAAPEVQATITVGKATATVTLTPASLSAVYDASPKPVGVTTVPSGLTVTVTYDGSAVAPTSAASYAVVATVDDANYLGSASGTLTIAKAPQVIIFVPPATRPHADASFDLAAHAIGGGSANPIAFAWVSGPGSISGTTLTFTGIGAIVVSASQAGDANYNAAVTVQGTTTVVKNDVTVTLSAASLSATYDGLPKQVVVTTVPAGLTVGVTYAGLAAAPIDAAAYPVVATVIEPYDQGSASGTLTIAKASQSIAFTPPPSATYPATIDLSTFASATPSGNPVTFTVTSGPGALAGSLLTFTGVGDVVVTASQAASANYDAATPVAATITVGKGTATVALTAASLDVTYDGLPKTAGVTTVPAGLGLTVTYAGSATAPTLAGAYAVVATVTDANYQGSATGTLTIAKAPQVITFTPPATRTYSDPPIDLSAHASGGGSGNPVTFALVSGPATLVGSTLTLTGAGAVVVSASQLGNDNYLAATTVQATISIGKVNATVTLMPVYLTVTYDGLPKHAGVSTTPVGLTVDVTYSGSPTAPTDVGTYDVVATVNDPNYQGSAAGTLAITRAAQAISFTPPATATYGDAALDLSGFVIATASGNPVTFAVTSGPASVTGSMLTFTGAGAVVVTASQAASANYTAAVPVQGAIAVGKAGAAVALTPGVASPVSGQALTFQLDVTAPGAVPTGTVSLLDGATLLGSAALASGTAAVSVPGGLLAGSHALSATYGGDANVLAATPATLTYQVAKSGSAVAVGSSRPGAATNQPVTYTATVSASGGAGTPSGTVTFKDGASSLGTGTLTAGVATLTVRSLVKGTHPITADYGGDAQFLTSSGTLAGGQVVPKSAPVAGSGSAVAFDGETQVARVEDPTGVLDGVRTVELWYKAAPAIGIACLVQQGEGEGLRFGLCLSAARTGFLIRRGAEVASITSTLDTGWHHLALVAGDTDTTLYLDGAMAAHLVGSFAAGAGQPVVIAGAPAGAGAADHFAGTVDELRLWSVSRTAAELADSARQPVAPDATGLVGLWRLDEGSGGSLFDAAPAHLEAILSAPGAGSWISSDAWRRRVTQEERLLSPFLAGYDPDGDPFTVALTSPPQGGQASVVGTTISYIPESRFLGVDSFTYQLSAGGLISSFTTDVEVIRIEVCQVPADCAGGDACVNGICVPPAAAESSGCNCSSSGQGSSTALLALLLLAFAARRRSPHLAARLER